MKKTGGPLVSDNSIDQREIVNVAVDVPGLYEIPRVSIQWILGMLVNSRCCVAGKDAVNWVP